VRAADEQLTCKRVLPSVMLRQTGPEAKPRGWAEPNLASQIMTSVSAVFAFPANLGFRSANMSKATLAVAPICDRPDKSTREAVSGRDPGPIDHWAESRNAEMFNSGAGKAGAVSLTWGYEWTDPGSSTQAHVASNAGGESCI